MYWGGVLAKGHFFFALQKHNFQASFCKSHCPAKTKIGNFPMYGCCWVVKTGSFYSHLDPNNSPKSHGSLALCIPNPQAQFILHLLRNRTVFFLDQRWEASVQTGSGDLRRFPWSTMREPPSCRLSSPLLQSIGGFCFAVFQVKMMSTFYGVCACMSKFC